MTLALVWPFSQDHLTSVSPKSQHVSKVKAQYFPWDFCHDRCFCVGKLWFHRKRKREPLLLCFCVRKINESSAPFLLAPTWFIDNITFIFYSNIVVLKYQTLEYHRLILNWGLVNFDMLTTFLFWVFFKIITTKEPNSGRIALQHYIHSGLHFKWFHETLYNFISYQRVPSF